MFEIIPNKNKEKEIYNSLKGGNLKSKFSIHERKSGYIATSASGNSELIKFLDGLVFLSNKQDDGNYSSWDVEPAKIISLQNAVMDYFG